MCDSLWGDEFKVPEKPKAKEIVKKIKKETLDANDENQIKKIVKNIDFFCKKLYLFLKMILFIYSKAKKSFLW